MHRALHVHGALYMLAYICKLWLLLPVCEHELEKYYYYCMLSLLVCAMATITVTVACSAWIVRRRCKDP